MKRVFKGLVVFSLSLVLGNVLFFNNNVSKYEIKNNVKTEKTGNDYSGTISCMTKDSLVKYANGDTTTLGQVKAIIRYYYDNLQVFVCDNPELDLLVNVNECEDEGLEFEGWYYDKELTQKVDGTTVGDAMGNPAIEIVEDENGCIKKFNYITNLYAKCSGRKVDEPTCEDVDNMYTINYVIENTVISKQTLEAGKDIETIIPTREGYVFEGWYIDKELNTKFDGNIELTEKYNGECLTGYEDVTLYGKWVKSDVVCDPVEYTFKLIYNTKGGNTIEDVTVTSSNGSTKIQTPSRTGYEFKGWYLDESLTKSANVKTLGDLNTEKYIDINGCTVGYKNVTLYAAWESSNNPNTGDNIVIYFILGLGLIAGSIIVTKKLTNK